jgi:hypothetical protein
MYILTKKVPHLRWAVPACWFADQQIAPQLFALYSLYITTLYHAIKTQSCC